MGALLRGQRYWPAQAALVVIAGAAEVARRRLAAAEVLGHLSPGVQGATAPPLGMLAAWGAAASAVNLGAMLVGRGPVPEGRAAHATGVILTLATSATAVAAVTTAPGGTTTAVARSYLATIAWALGGIRCRPAPTRPDGRCHGGCRASPGRDPARPV